MPVRELDSRIGRFRYRTVEDESNNGFYNFDSKPRKHNKKRRRSLRKDKIYLPPSDWYQYNHADNPRDVTSPYHDQPSGTYLRPLNVPVGTKSGRKIVYEKLFPGNVRRGDRKAMVIGERPSLWNVSEQRRPQLPSNLFVDNLRHNRHDWRKYGKVTWSDILESQQKDAYTYRSYAQTLPQKEAWLSSIDHRVKYSKMHPDRGLPYISPRLFNNKVVPPKPPQHTRYLSKDKMGNVFYLVGPSDVTNKKYKPYLFPEIVKHVATPKKLNF